MVSNPAGQITRRSLSAGWLRDPFSRAPHISRAQLAAISSRAWDDTARPPWEKGTPRISRLYAREVLKLAMSAEEAPRFSIAGGVIVPPGQIAQASTGALSPPHDRGGESGQDERGTHRSELPTAD